MNEPTDTPVERRRNPLQFRGHYWEHMTVDARLRDSTGRARHSERLALPIIALWAAA